jgi:hypothetical protein
LPDGQPGITTLPVARVQRIVKADKEIQMVNKEAIFALSVVTVGPEAIRTGWCTPFDAHCLPLVSLAGTLYQTIDRQGV